MVLSWKTFGCSNDKWLGLALGRVLLLAKIFGNYFFNCLLSLNYNRCGGHECLAQPTKVAWGFYACPYGNLIFINIVIVDLTLS